KLKFFRLAYGAAGGFGARVDVAEARAVVDALARDAKRVAVNWALAESRLSKPAVKVLLNFAHMGIEALVRGGTIDIGAEVRDGATEIVVRAAGARIAFDETIGAALEGNLSKDKLSSRTAPAHLLCLLADHAGGGLQYRQTPDALVLGAVLPNG